MTSSIRGGGPAHRLHSQTSGLNNQPSSIDCQLPNILSYLDHNERQIRATSINFKDAAPLSRALFFNYKCDRSQPITLEDIRNFSFKSKNHFKLDLSGSNINDTELKKIIERFPNITAINATNCQNLTDRGLRHLRGMQLESLNLSGCIGITNAGLKYLRGMQLESLNLSGCRITNGGLVHLQGLPLKNLDLSYLQITNDDLAHLQGLPLENLNLVWCLEITDAGLAHLRGLPLKNLNLAWCLDITDAGLAHLQEVPLEYLNLFACFQITDACFAHLQWMPLANLNLSGCSRVMDDGLARLSELPLKSLDLTGCSKIALERQRLFTGDELNQLLADLRIAHEQGTAAAGGGI